MPLYAYRCTNGHEFEVRQRFSDDPVEVCPQCGAEVRRVITQVGVVFKGSGFYVTDNRNGKVAGKANGSGKSSEAKSDSAETEKSSSSGTTGDKGTSTSTSAGAAA